MARSFASHSYERELPKAENHVRYIAFRSRESEEHEKGLFNEHDNHIEVKDFIRDLNDKKTSHPSVAVIHKVLFSMSGDEWEKSGFEPEDYKIMIRNIMKDYELKTGRTINWAAAAHMNAGHPHVHLVMKATYTDKDGIEHRLKIDNEDRKFFAQAFTREKNRIRGFEIEKPEREYERHQNRQQSKSISNAIWLDALFRELDKELREKEREGRSR